MLRTRKIYVDTRYKSPDSKSNSDFIIDLPYTVEIPDNSLCFLNDFVIPVSYTVVDSRNKLLYFSIIFLGNITYHVCELQEKNFNGDSLVVEIKSIIDGELTEEMKRSFSITCSSNYLDNVFIISINDIRPNPSGNVCTIIIYSDKDLNVATWNLNPLTPRSVNNLFNLNETVYITSENFYKKNLDLHSTRNLYLHSSTLNNYQIITNWGCDTVVKKIAVRCGYNELIIDSNQQGYDNLHLEKMSINKIKFWLTDSNNNIIDLKGSHFSFSILFQLKG